jgi:Mn2+/Fe2+ NRAMP family transporter
MTSTASSLIPRRPRFWGRLAKFLAIMGPGIITANVDNDAGGLATYSHAGAAFGLKYLWVLLPVGVALIMVQEMVNRMGIVTGEGLSSLIRERFGARITFYLMVVLFLTNLGNVMAEFAGIASAGALFGVPPWLSVPVCAFLVWGLVLKYNYRSIEKIFLISCLFYVAYLVTAVLVAPDWAEVGKALVTPSFDSQRADLVLILGLIGTTIAPWMQFYQQAAVVEKNVGIENLGYSKADTIVGGLAVNLVAGAIIVVCGLTLFKAGIPADTAAEAARSLEPLAGPWAGHLFAFGLWNASMFAASILPLSTSYTVCEALGFERGVDHDYHEAPQFYVLYTAAIVLGAAIVLLPGVDLMQIMIGSQVVNGLLLPIILVFMLVLVNDRDLMGEYANGPAYNIVSVAMVAAVSGLSLVYVGTLF